MIVCVMHSIIAHSLHKIELEILSYQTYFSLVRRKMNWIYAKAWIVSQAKLSPPTYGSGGEEFDLI